METGYFSEILESCLKQGAGLPELWQARDILEVIFGVLQKEESIPRVFLDTSTGNAVKELTGATDVKWSSVLGASDLILGQENQVPEKLELARTLMCVLMDSLSD